MYRKSVDQSVVILVVGLLLNSFSQVYAFGEKALPTPKPLPKSKALPVGKALPKVRSLPATKSVPKTKKLPVPKRVPKAKPLVLKSAFSPRATSDESLDGFDPRYDSPSEVVDKNSEDIPLLFSSDK